MEMLFFIDAVAAATTADATTAAAAAAAATILQSIDVAAQLKASMPMLLLRSAADHTQKSGCSRW